MVTGNRDITKRMNYFDRQFLRAQDFVDEQDYHLDRRRRHNKFFHSAGIADLPDGLRVVQKVDTTDQVTVQPGWAVDEDGREIIVLPAGRDVTIARSGPGAVEIYLAYPDPEPPSDESQDPGVEGFTRVHERAVLTRVPGDASSQPAKSLWLATITVDGGGSITGIADRRQPAGVAAHNILDRAVTEPKLADNAVTSAKISEADGTSGQNTNAGSGVKEGHLQDQAVSANKLRADANDANDGQRAVTTNHIRNLNVTALKLANDTVITRVLAASAVTEPKLDPFVRNGLAAGFCAFDGTAGAGGALLNHHNVGSAGKSGIGRYVVKWASRLSAEGPVFAFASFRGLLLFAHILALSDTAVEIQVVNANNLPVDAVLHVLAFRTTGEP